MIASIDISYYPLNDDYRSDIVSFITSIKAKYTNLTFEVGGFSTIIIGEYDTIMSIFQNEVKETLNKNKCVFIVKFAAGERIKENLPEQLK